jgi:hypothetical protein
MEGQSALAIAEAEGLTVWRLQQIVRAEIVAGSAAAKRNDDQAAEKTRGGESKDFALGAEQGLMCFAALRAASRGFVWLRVIARRSPLPVYGERMGEGLG